MYWRPPSESDLADKPWFTPADFPEPVCEVWPENWDTLQLYARHSTQWRTGMNGITSLDHSVFMHAMDRKGWDESKQDVAFAQLAVIESQALYQLHKQT